MQEEERTCTMYPLAPLMRHPRPDTMPQEMMRALSQVEEPKKRRHWFEGICTLTQVLSSTHCSQAGHRRAGCSSIMAALGMRPVCKS